MDSVSKTLMILGLLLIGASLLWHLSGGNIPIGKLPGDIKIETENTKIYFPITTGLILSLLFSLLAYLFRK
jgi:hypothetical protein